jgi:signal transduction histidine kinase
MDAMKLAADTAEASLATKKTFVRYVSHEIRTPLSISKLGLDLILEEVGQLGSSTAMCSLKSTVNECRQSMDVAVSILDDLLNYEKLEGGIMDIYRIFVPVVDFVDKTLRPFYLHAKHKGVIFQVLWNLDLNCFAEGAGAGAAGGATAMTSEQLFLLVDETKMSQVFRNLASNAIKFTKPGGNVTIKCTVDNETEELLPPTPVPDVNAGESATFNCGRSNITENSDMHQRCVCKSITGFFSCIVMTYCVLSTYYQANTDM